MTTKYNLNYRDGKIRTLAVDYLAKHPGRTSAEMAEALGLSEKSASNALRNMHEAGLTTRYRAGKYYTYMLKAEQSRPAEQPEQLEDLSGLRKRLARARGTIRELEAFKADAIAKYPDLEPINYESYRQALVLFFRARNSKVDEHHVSTGGILTQYYKDHINGLIAYEKTLPRGDS